MLTLQCRPLGEADVPLIAVWNRRLQQDEGATPMPLDAIEARLARWLAADYDGLVFETGQGPVGYALFRSTDPDLKGPGGIYLRQFFITPEARGGGLGREAFALFVDRCVGERRLVLEALASNPGGLAFWERLGLRRYSTTLERPAGTPLRDGAGREPEIRGAPIGIVPFAPEMSGACAAILAALPEWFGIPEANAEYVRRLPELETWVARREGEIVGFVGLEEHYPESVENHVLAVHPAHRRHGIGWALLAHAERGLRERGVEVFHVKTLGPSEDYPPYAETRAFYRAFGFRPLFETTAIWGEENPTLVLAKSLV